MILLVGTDESLLEGLTQLLAGNGHRARVAHSVDEAEDMAAISPPLLMVVPHSAVSADGGARVGKIPLAPGGAHVLYRTTSDEGDAISVARAIARQTLADLTLPLERHRLLALAQYVSARARERGRSRFDTPPERRAF